MEITISGRLGTDGLYVTRRGKHYLVTFRPTRWEPVAGHRLAPFVKWGYEYLVAPITGDMADFPELAREAFQAPVR